MTGKLLDNRYQLVKKSGQAEWPMFTWPRISFWIGS